MKRHAPLRRTGKLPPRNAARRRREFARCYHSKERVAWVKRQPCIVIGCPSSLRQNMHIEGGGAGRKADYTKIVPCCSWHHETAHRVGIQSFQGLYGLDLSALAVATQKQWEAFQEGR